MLPEARRRIAEVAAMNVELMRLAERARSGEQVTADAKGIDASIHDALAWFEREGIQVKGVAPALLDFPAIAAEGEVLLCWLHGEDDIDWFHDTETGFAGRAPLAELTW